MFSVGSVLHATCAPIDCHVIKLQSMWMRPCLAPEFTGVTHGLMAFLLSRMQTTLNLFPAINAHTAVPPSTQRTRMPVPAVALTERGDSFIGQIMGAGESVWLQKGRPLPINVYIHTYIRIIR